jgi:hypothetical protein
MSCRSPRRRIGFVKRRPRHDELAKAGSVRESFRPMSYNPRRRLPAWTARPRSPSEAKEMNVKEHTIFKEIDELLLGVFGDLTDDEILKRVADQAGG